MRASFSPFYEALLNTDIKFQTIQRENILPELAEFAELFNHSMLRYTSGNIPVENLEDFVQYAKFLKDGLGQTREIFSKRSFSDDDLRFLATFELLVSRSEAILARELDQPLLKDKLEEVAITMPYVGMAIDLAEPSIKLAGKRTVECGKLSLKIRALVERPYIDKLAVEAALKQLRTFESYCLSLNLPVDGPHKIMFYEKLDELDAFVLFENCRYYTEMST